MTAALFWPAAVMRALSPARLLAVVLGLAITQAILLIPPLVQEQPIRFLQPPWELVQSEIARGSGRTVFWGLVLGAAIGAVWSLVGAWVAWLEFRGQKPDQESPPVTAFLQRKAGTLCGTVFLVLGVVSFLVFLSWVAAGINALLPWGIGATVLAVVLPLLLLLGFAVVVVVVGCVSLPIMPASTAAEGSDSFEAVSRGFSYLYQRPLEYALWGGLALFLAALPLAGTLSLVQGEQPLLGAEAQAILPWIGLILSLSIFWSLQPLVYVKMRWLVDDVVETQLWLGQEEKKPPETTPAPVPAGNATQRGTSDFEEEFGETTPAPVPAGNATPPDQAGGGEPSVPPLEPVAPTPDSTSPAAEQTKQEGPPKEPDAEKLTPARDTFTFAQTLTLGNAGAPNKMVGLLPGVAWAALVLAGGLWAGSQLVEGGSEWTLEGQRELVGKLAGQRPLALALLFLAVVVLTAVGLGRWMRMIARMIAVRVVYEQEISLAAQALPFARRSGNQGLVSVLLLSAAVVLFLTVLPLAFLVWTGSASWPEPVGLTAVALVLGALGALGLAAVSVDGRRLDETATSPLGNYVSNGGELLASALAALGMGVLRWAALLAMAVLTWLFVCESLGWAGGDARWVRWGLDGRLVPEVEGPLYWLASRIAGIWFFVLFGTVLSYPLSYLLRWGVVSYLRARQQSEDRPAEPLELDDEERGDLLQGQKKRKQRKKK